MSNELIGQPKSFDLAAPQQAMQVAEILQRFVKEKNLISNIKGKMYPQVEAWQFAGSQLGLYPILTEVTDLSTEKIGKYKATVEIRRLSDDKIMSRGVAICSKAEASKQGFDEYAICSMAQTRAEGKAFRMLLSWIMKAAGFEATPAEEMDFAKAEAIPDFLMSWEVEINNCVSVNDLLTLYEGNKETVNADEKIKTLFKNRQNKIKNEQGQKNNSKQPQSN